MTPFWIAAAALTSVLVAALVWPLFRQRDGDAAATDPAVALYRDQLKEIDRDVERGVITVAEAEGLRLEIQRRLLAADARSKAERASERANPRPVAVALAVFIAGGSFATYVALGSPGIPDQPLAARAETPHGSQKTADLVRMAAALKARLEQTPEQTEGWFLLGRTYRTLDRFQESAEAFRRAVIASDRNWDALSAYGGALVLANDGTVSSEARAAFDEALKKNPFDNRSRFYIGVAQVQTGEARGALQTWTDLIATSPVDAPWLPQVRAHIAEVAGKVGIDPATVKPTPGLPKP